MSPTFGGYILKKLGVFQVILILNMQPETSSQEQTFHMDRLFLSPEEAWGN